LDKTTVFVYGTLLKGFHGHNTFLKDADYLGEATIKGDLYHLPFGYPAVICRKNSANTVRGELYKVDAEKLKWLRKYEGVEGLNSVYREIDINCTADCGEDRSKVFAASCAKEWVIRLIGHHVADGDWRSFANQYNVGSLMRSFRLVSAGMLMTIASFTSIIYLFQEFMGTDNFDGL